MRHRGARGGVGGVAQHSLPGFYLLNYSTRDSLWILEKNFKEFHMDD